MHPFGVTIGTFWLDNSLELFFESTDDTETVREWDWDDRDEIFDDDEIIDVDIDWLRFWWRFWLRFWPWLIAIEFNASLVVGCVTWGIGKLFINELPDDDGCTIC